MQEISTVFLISKRHINAEQFPTLMGLWKVLDHVTWIGIRCLLFPFGSYNILMVFMYQCDQLVSKLPQGGRISDIGSLLRYVSCYFHLGTFCTMLLFLMGAMNVFWTINKYFKSPKRTKGEGKGKGENKGKSESDSGSSDEVEGKCSACEGKHVKHSCGKQKTK